MAYKSYIILDTPKVISSGATAGSEVPVGIQSANTWRVDVLISSGDGTALDVQTWTGIEWLTIGSLALGNANTYSLTSGDVAQPLGSKVRVRATGTVTVERVSITLDR